MTKNGFSYCFHALSPRLSVYDGLQDPRKTFNSINISTWTASAFSSTSLVDYDEIMEFGRSKRNYEIDEMRMHNTFPDSRNSGRAQAFDCTSPWMIGLHKVFTLFTLGGIPSSTKYYNITSWTSGLERSFLFLKSAIRIFCMKEPAAASFTLLVLVLCFCGDLEATQVTGIYDFFLLISPGRE